MTLLMTIKMSAPMAVLKMDIVKNSPDIQPGWAGAIGKNLQRTGYLLREVFICVTKYFEYLDLIICDISSPVRNISQLDNVCG